jgi:pimeloyl-ACP methyl ester carboxylesterase
MSTFCLVHGSTQNPSGWDLLVRELAALGHRSICPALPTDLPGASASVYADVIAESLPPRGDEVIVVAHSASGIFLPLVAQHASRIVFLAAVIPELGASIVDQLKADPSMVNPHWAGKDPTRDDDAARQFLFHDCAPEVVEWALTTRSRMYAKQAMLEICPLKSWPQTPASYIVCTDDRTIQPEWSRRAARERLDVEPLELPGGHCPHVSRPAALAAMLDRL